MDPQPLPLAGKAEGDSLAGDGRDEQRDERGLHCQDEPCAGPHCDDLSGASAAMRAGFPGQNRWGGCLPARGMV